LSSDILNTDILN